MSKRLREETIVLNQPPSHPNCHLIGNLDSLMNVPPPPLKIPSQPIESNSFDQRIDLMTSSCALFFGTRVHDTVFDTVIETAALRVGEDDEKVRETGEEV